MIVTPETRPEAEVRLTALMVRTLGNRPCIPHEIAKDFPPELWEWTRNNCEYSVNADVWLLPVSEEV